MPSHKVTFTYIHITPNKNATEVYVQYCMWAMAFTLLFQVQHCKSITVPTHTSRKKMKRNLNSWIDNAITSVTIFSFTVDLHAFINSFDASEWEVLTLWQNLTSPVKIICFYFGKSKWVNCEVFVYWCCTLIWHNEKSQTVSKNVKSDLLGSRNLLGTYLFC